MANPFNFPIFKAFTTSGTLAPLSLGYLYTFEAGTSTPQSVYQDEALTTPHTNPVTLDANGEAIIYLGPNAYKMRLEDIEGNIQPGWPIDDIPGAGAESAAIYAAFANTSDAAKGDALVGVKQPFTGATSRTQHDKNQEVINVDDFLSVAEAIANSPSGSTVNFGAGKTYTITDEIPLRSNLTINGNGATIICTSRIRSYFYGKSLSNLVITGLVFDLAKTYLPVYQVTDYPNYYNTGVYLDECDNVRIFGNRFIELYTRSIYAHSCSGHLHISDNYFASPTQSQTQSLEHVAVGQFAGNVIVDKNMFVNAAYTNPAYGVCCVTMAGTSGSATVSDNYMENTGRDNTGSHKLGAIDFYGDHQNVSILNNKVTGLMCSFMRLSSTHTGNIIGNEVNTSANVEVGCTLLSIEGVTDYYGVPVARPGIKDITVRDNAFFGSAARSFGVTVGAYDYAYPSTNIYICHNKFKDFDKSILMSGPFDGISIKDNDISGAGKGTIAVSAQGSVPTTDDHGTTESQSVYKRLAITGNISKVNDAGAYQALVVSFLKVPAYTGTVGDIEILDNSFESISAGSGFAALIEANTVTRKERFRISGNTTRKFNTAWYIRDCGEVWLSGNRSISCVNGLSDGGGMTFLDARDNRWSDSGALQGNATLVGGTVAVITAEARTGDVIELIKNNAGGTSGLVYVSAITDKTSFVITSTSGTDTSSIHWRICH